MAGTTWAKAEPKPNGSTKSNRWKNGKIILVLFQEFYHFINCKSYSNFLSERKVRLRIFIVTFSPLSSEVLFQLFSL
jgi:hypothetical protein